MSYLFYQSSSDKLHNFAWLHLYYPALNVHMPFEDNYHNFVPID